MQLPEYANKAELTTLFLEAQRTGVVPPKILEIAGLIVAGLQKRFYFPKEYIEDTTAELHIIILTKFQNVDASRNVFGWMTQCAFNALRARWRVDYQFACLKDNFFKSKQKSYKGRARKNKNYESE